MLNILSILAVVANMQVVQPIIVKTPDLEIDFTPRTANQLGSFYEARGFPREMREVLAEQCFTTVGILNTSDKKIWLELSNWKFSAAGKPIKRQHREFWKQRWQGILIFDIPLQPTCC